MAIASNAAVASDGRARKLRRGPLTRKQILDAALTLFSERGTARSSVRDIAQIAGITDAAIYYHFPSKRDLFEALIEERGFTAALQNLETADISEAAAMAPGEAIRTIAEGALELMYANRGFMKVLMVEAMAEDPVAAEEYRMLVERWEKAEARILKVYAARGILRTHEVDELAKQLVVTVIGAFADYLMSPVTTTSLETTPPPELMQHVRVAMQHIVQGIT
ncbi:MAG: TetR/AcrR family transcriptional regulator [Chloroflexota bacterium]|nr:TetR/AcrR family transcriptional regulator [Chloroflexota bacterium]